MSQLEQSFLGSEDMVIFNFKMFPCTLCHIEYNEWWGRLWCSRGSGGEESETFAHPRQFQSINGDTCQVQLSKNTQESIVSHREQSSHLNKQFLLLNEVSLPQKPISIPDTCRMFGQTRTEQRVRAHTQTHTFTLGCVQACGKGSEVRTQQREV